MSHDGQQDKFRDRADRWDPDHVEQPWKPEPGDMLIGEVVDRDDDRSTQFGACTVLVIADEDSGEEFAVWCFHEVMRREVERQNPGVGERVAIKRLADGTLKDGKKYRKYKVAVDRPAPQPTAASPAITPRGPLTSEQLYGPAAPKREEAESSGPLDPEDADIPF